MHYPVKYSLFIFLVLTVTLLNAQDVTITVDSDSLGARVSPTLHGIFFEEISHGGEGGLYAELIQNRSFEESRVPPGCSLDSGWLIPPRTPHFRTGKVSDWKMKWEPHNPWPGWSLQTKDATASFSISTTHPLYPENPQALQVDIQKVNSSGTVSIVNEGFWGIRVDEGALYQLTFYVRTEKLKGDIQASLQTEEGKILAAHTFKKIGNHEWKKFTCTLKANGSASKAKLHLSLSTSGTLWLDFVSLFPEKTFKGRSNGMRVDLANYLAELKPSFVRWPGGCFVEGISTESAPEWKRSIGPLEKRPGTYSPWGYWSSDGIGYHEFLQFCEDIDADAMYVFNVGIACEMRAGVYAPEEDMTAILDNILDGIEYAIGPAESKWGKERARNGHSAPFPLKYIEVGNEQIGPKYADRFNFFYKAIKEKYPQLEIIASMGIAHLSQPTIDAIEKMDMADEHAYKGIYWPMIYHDWYDKYKRNDWKLYVGEYACNSGVGSGNMMAALNDATYILGMERNSDMITMSSYAPLLENVNDTDWPVNLIRFDNASSFARASYYAIKMMNEHKASINFNTTIKEEQPEKDAAPLYGGLIGLSTWDTQSEFKDITIEAGENVFYQADFSTKLDDWNREGGKWEVKGDALAQTADGAWPLAVLNKELPDEYVLKLKARRTGGPNAFMIPFALRDNKNYMRAHIGAWWNRIAAFEIVGDGVDAIVTQPVNLKQPIETNRWYAIELHVKATRVECYLDGELLMTYTEPRKVFSISGKDEVSGDVIVKIVNAKETQLNAAIQLKDIIVKNNAKAIILQANSATDENSFENPKLIVPKEKEVNNISNSFIYTLEPFSVTILRIHTTD